VVKPEIHYVEKLVEVPHVLHQERIVEVPEVEYREVVKEVHTPVIQYVDKEVSKPVINYVEKIVEEPARLRQEQIVEVPQAFRAESFTEVVRPQYQEIPRQVLRARESLAQAGQELMQPSRSYSPAPRLLAAESTGICTGAQQGVSYTNTASTYTAAPVPVTPANNDVQLTHSGFAVASTRREATRRYVGTIGAGPGYQRPEQPTVTNFEAAAPAAMTMPMSDNRGPWFEEQATALYAQQARVSMGTTYFEAGGGAGYGYQGQEPVAPVMGTTYFEADPTPYGYQGPDPNAPPEIVGASAMATTYLAATGPAASGYQISAEPPAAGAPLAPDYGGMMGPVDYGYQTGPVDYGYQTQEFSGAAPPTAGPVEYGYQAGPVDYGYQTQEFPGTAPPTGGYYRQDAMPGYYGQDAPARTQYPGAPPDYGGGLQEPARASPVERARSEQRPEPEVGWFGSLIEELAAA
jgi:hypothetical protein